LGVYSLGILFVALSYEGPRDAASLADRLARLVRAPSSYFKAVASSPSPEHIFIDIKFRHLQTIRKKRAEALERGILMASSSDLVPASIRHGDRTIRVRLRLKGDFTDHFRGDKWSFRVHVRKGDQIFGLRRFSLQDPATRAFQAEPIVLEHLRREGILAPRYFFVDVTLNGKHLGLMAVEEHFSKELLESQQRREGVIIRFDEDPFFHHLMLNGSFGPYVNPLVATVRPFRSGKIQRSERLSSNLAVATGLLRGFLEGRLSASEVFDVELLARFIAVAEVWHAEHMLPWHNLRLYLNPVTMRLEPIGFDANVRDEVGDGLVSRLRVITARALDDPEVRSAFLVHMRRIAGEMSDGTLASWVLPMEDQLLGVLHRELPSHPRLGLERFVPRADQLRKISEENWGHFGPGLGHPEMRNPQPIRAYLYPGAQQSRLELVNTLPVPVSVTSLRLRHTGGGTEELQLDPPRSLPILLAPTPLREAPEPLELSFRAPGPDAEWGIEGTIEVRGQAQPRAFEAEPYQLPLSESPIPVASLADALAQHPFLRWDAEAEILRVEAGEWEVQGSLVLPEGLGLELVAGTTLRFGPGEALVASGPLHLSGDPGSPIVLEGRREPEGDGSWAGVVVLSSGEPYAWRHVLVRGTTGIERNGWQLTGGVTLRDSEVEISDSTFRGNRGEDALNLIRSRFVLKDVSFYDAFSDALDADHSDGSIEGGHFARIGGDAIDVSGAHVTVSQVRLEDIHDKALSVGEGSDLTGRDLHIGRVGIGAASKDSSKLLLEDSEIQRADQAGIMVYTKKPEYGPAEAVVTNVVMDRVNREAAVQTGSRIVIDGSEVEPEDLDVEELYRTGSTRR
jgi:hypothetical protein